LGLAEEKEDFKRIGLILDYYFNVALENDVLKGKIPAGATVMVCDERIIYKNVAKKQRSPTPIVFEFSKSTSHPHATDMIIKYKTVEFTKILGLNENQITNLLETLRDADHDFFKTKKRSNIFKLHQVVADPRDPADATEKLIKNRLVPTFDVISSTSSIGLRPNFIDTLNKPSTWRLLDQRNKIDIKKFRDKIMFGGAVCWSLGTLQECYEYAIDIQEEQLAQIIQVKDLKPDPVAVVSEEFLYHFSRTLQSYETIKKGVTTNCANRPENTYGENEDLVEKERDT